MPLGSKAVGVDGGAGGAEELCGWKPKETSRLRRNLGLGESPEKANKHETSITVDVT